MLLASMPGCLVEPNQKELNMQHALYNRATIRVADKTDVSGRVTADEVNLDRFHNRIRKVCALVAAGSKVYLSAATLILIVALADPASAQQQVPFKGAIQGEETDTVVSFPTQSAHGDTTRIASLVGKLKFTFDLTIDLLHGTGTGTGHLSAANGDNIYTMITGSFELIAPGIGSVTEFDTITGGTGRFAGAQGSFIMERLVDGVPNGPNPHFTSGSFHGTITSPGAGSDGE
jgi:hypothetical protein